MAAWLIDVYRTTLEVDFTAAWSTVAGAAGVDAAELRAAAGVHVPEVMIGRRTFRSALGEALEACGAPVDDARLDELMAIDRQAVLDCSQVHDDVVGLLRRIRAAGEPVAFVSNCDDNTRYFLTELGLAGQVDVMVLSHEIGVAKPDPGIYERALAELGVGAGSAVFVDDDPSFCRGAREVGIRAVLVDRTGGASDVGAPDLGLDDAAVRLIAPSVAPGVEVVRSLDEIAVG